MKELLIEIRNKNAEEIIDSLEKMKAIKIKPVSKKRGKPDGIETYLLSESALSKDWLKKSEDKAWKNL